MPDEFEELVKRAHEAESQRQAKHRAEQNRQQTAKETHMALAKKFISAMHSRGIAPLSVCRSGRREVYREWSRQYTFFPRRVQRIRETYGQIGEGWIIRDYRGESSWDRCDGHDGLVLMTDSRVHIIEHPHPNQLSALSVCIREMGGHDPLRFLAREGSDQLLANAVIGRK